MDKRLGYYTRSGGAAVCLILGLASCGLYGEQGFSGRDPLSPERFIEEIDERCHDANEALDEDVAKLLGGTVADVDDPKDAIAELMRSGDELAEKLDRVNGPDNLEKRRDEFVDVLEEVDGSFRAARRVAEDQPNAADALMETAKRRFREAELQLRSARFRVCGLPRPPAAD